MFKKISLLIALLAISQFSVAQDVYSIDRDSANIYKIDVTDGSTISSVAMTDGGVEIDNATAIDKNPVSGDLFVIYESAVGANNTFQPRKSGNTIQGGGGSRLLGIVEPETGVITQIGATGDSFSDIAFKPDGTLYGIVGTGGSDNGGLYSIDINDGTTTLQENLNDDSDGEALTYNPVQGVFYQSDDQDLYTVDPVTFSATLLANTSNDEVTGIHFDPESSNMFLVDLEDNLYQMASDGALTLIGPMDHQSKGVVVAAPAVVYQVPSLSIFGLMALALGLVLLVRKESNA